MCLNKLGATYLCICFSIACTHNGAQYRIGESVEVDCSERLVCQPGGMFDPVEQVCTYVGQASANGDPHYLTYDGWWHHFQGKCEYVLTKLCDSDAFTVLAKNDGHPSNIVSCVSKVTVLIPALNRKIELGRRHNGGTITIDGDLKTDYSDRVHLNMGGVKVERVGGHPYVYLTDHGVRVTFDGYYYVKVAVATRLKGKLCGLLGTYNDNPSDDMRLPDGSTLTSENDIDTFGNSWLVPSTIPGCTGETKRDAPGLSACSNDPTVIAQAQTRCNVTRQEPFSTCNSVLDPTPFIENCEFDYCCCPDNEREDCYCDNLETYAAACAKAGRPPSNWKSLYCRKELVYNSIQ